VITAINLSLSILTFNLLSDLTHWISRRELVIDGLLKLQPDLIALQEVKLPENTAAWVADKINFECTGKDPYHVHLCRKTGDAGEKEGLAFLSRIPIDFHVTLDLRTQNRVAHYLQISPRGKPLIVVNGHFFWQPGESSARQKQIKILLNRLEHIPGRLPKIVCGDFNATPESPSIRRLKQEYISAYEFVHGSEPEYTAPTPLQRSPWAVLRTLVNHLKYMQLNKSLLRWRAVLDYIFVDPIINIEECELAMDQPSLKDQKIYPSDHFGIYARLEY